MQFIQQYGSLLARLLLAALFLVTGIGKITSFADTAQFVASTGLPAATAITALVIIIEIGGALMLIFGYKTRIAAAALFVFALLTAFIFHFDFPAQKEIFLKNLAIAGGMLLLLVHGCGSIGLDNKTHAAETEEDETPRPEPETQSTTDRVDTPPLT